MLIVKYNHHLLVAHLGDSNIYAAQKVLVILVFLVREIHKA